MNSNRTPISCSTGSKADDEKKSGNTEVEEEVGEIRRIEEGDEEKDTDQKSELRMYFLSSRNPRVQVS